MFWSIPSSSREIRANTPFGAKSIRSIFFENKNNGIFYQEKLDTVTISIDGRIICRNLAVVPFCTTAPTLKDRFDWMQVAMIVNMNVNNSEVIISGTRDNDFNIVFVYDDKNVNEIKGFDFIETKEIVIAKNGGWGLSPADEDERKRLVTAKKEVAVSCDYVPLYTFAYPHFIQQNDNKLFNLPHYLCCNMNIDITGTEKRLLPENLSLSAISANQRTTWREIAYRFEEDANKNFNLLYEIAENSTLADIAKNIDSPTVDIDGESFNVNELRVLFCYMYKKIS